GLHEQVVAVGEVVGRGPGRDPGLGVDGAERQPARALPGQHLDRRVDQRRPPLDVPPHVDTTPSVVLRSDHYRQSTTVGVVLCESSSTTWASASTAASPDRTGSSTSIRSPTTWWRG